jgi:hypothetical protein
LRSEKTIVTERRVSCDGPAGPAGAASSSGVPQ